MSEQIGLCKYCWEVLCSQCQENLIENGRTVDALKAHAVEVLFKYISRHHEMTEEKEKAMKQEARALLGWEE